MIASVVSETHIVRSDFSPTLRGFPQRTLHCETDKREAHQIIRYWCDPDYSLTLDKPAPKASHVPLQVNKLVHLNWLS